MRTPYTCVLCAVTFSEGLAATIRGKGVYEIRKKNKYLLIHLPGNADRSTNLLNEIRREKIVYKFSLAGVRVRESSVNLPAHRLIVDG